MSQKKENVTNIICNIKIHLTKNVQDLYIENHKILREIKDINKGIYKIHKLEDVIVKLSICSTLSHCTC